MIQDRSHLSSSCNMLIIPTPPVLRMYSGAEQIPCVSLSLASGHTPHNTNLCVHQIALCIFPTSHAASYYWVMQVSYINTYAYSRASTSSRSPPPIECVCLKYKREFYVEQS